MRGRPAGVALLLVVISCTSSPSPTQMTAETSATTTPSPGPDASLSHEGAPDRPTTDQQVGCWAAARQPEPGPLVFGDLTREVGLWEPLLGMHGHAVAVGDFDGDGWKDLFVGTFADRPTDAYRVRGAEEPSPDRLLRGGPGGFVVDASFPEVFSRTSGAAVADLDGDGAPDLVAARNYRRGQPDPVETVVYRNDGGILAEAVRLLPEFGARSVGVLDYDRDGRPDLFIVEDRWSGGSSTLLRNEGGFRFRDVTREAGLPDDVHGLGVAVADLNRDGRPDLFVGGSNRLFVNLGEEGFREVDGWVFEWEVYGNEDDPAGVATADLNRDLLPDIVVGQHYNSTLDFGERVPVRLYLNQGPDGEGMPMFAEVTERSGLVPLPTKAPHVEVVDLDNDGWPDILTSASAGDGEVPAIFRHQGLDSAGIPRFSTPEGLGDPQYWVTGVTLDVDRDGALDVMLVEWEPARPSLLLRNETRGGHWLGVEVRGPDALGTVVEVYQAGRSGELDGLVGSAEISGSRGYGAGVGRWVHLGLGTASEVDLVVRSPGGDGVELERVPADRYLVLDPAQASSSRSAC